MPTRSLSAEYDAYNYKCDFGSDVPGAAAIYTLSLHDALPISTTTRWVIPGPGRSAATARSASPRCGHPCGRCGSWSPRSEEHTSELQSRLHLVCRLLLEKKKIVVSLCLHPPSLLVPPACPELR